MTTSDQNQSQPHGGEHGAGTAAAPQAESGGGGARHGRGRRRGGGGRPEQQLQRPQPRQQQRSESGLNMEELRELTELFTTHGLTDFEFENADIRIRLSRNLAPAAPQAAPAQGGQSPQAAMQTASAGGSQAAPAASQPPAAEAAPPQPAPPEEELHIVTSPIVGTFYRSPSPNDEPFVKVGSQVENDTVVCIIEAMKLMNEIQAETAGTVAKIYVENGQPVEYGQALFGVKK